MEILFSFGVIYLAMTVVGEGLGWLGHVESTDVSLSERLHNIAEVFFGDRSAREIRHTAVGWRPDETWTEDMGRTPSGQREYYKVIRKGKKS